MDFEKKYYKIIICCFLKKVIAWCKIHIFIPILIVYQKEKVFESIMRLFFEGIFFLNVLK